MNATSSAKGSTLATRFGSFALEGLKLFGIAVLALMIIWAAVIVSIKTGISIPARWLGLFSSVEKGTNTVISGDSPRFRERTINHLRTNFRVISARK